MKAIMSGLLSGWAVNDERMMSPDGRSSCMSVTRTATAAGRRGPRQYGWQSSLASSNGSRGGERGGGQRRGEVAARVQAENRLALRMYSPYFSPPRRAASRRAKHPGKKNGARRLPGSAVCTSRGERRAAQAQATTTSSRPLLPEPWLPDSPRRLQSPAAAADTSRSSGGVFFKALAQSAPVPRCGRVGGDLVLPDLRCPSGGGAERVRDSSYPPRDVNPRSRSNSPHAASSERRVSSHRSSSRADSGEDAAPANAVAQQRIREWEAACVMEEDALQKRKDLSRAVHRLRKEINEADSGLKSLSMREISLREQMRSFTALQLEVVRQERKNKELQHLAALSRERVKNVKSSYEKKHAFDQTASSTINVTGEGGGRMRHVDDISDPWARANLMDKRASLQRKRLLLKQAVHEASARSVRRWTNSIMNRSSSTPMQDAEQRRLEQTISSLMERERRLKLRVKQSEKRADVIMEHIEDLRCKIQAKKAECRGPAPQRHVVSASKQTHAEENTVNDGHMNSCFITELTM